jgi:hypothetical protein
VTTGAYLLLAIGGILSLGGWVMLLVLGFKKSTGWGLTILFLSWLIVPLVIFLVKYWSEAKTGFLLMIVGTVASGIGWFAVVGSVATSAMADFESFDLTQPDVTVEQPATAVPDEEPAPTLPDEEVPPSSPEELPDEAALLATPTPGPPPTPAGTVLGERVDWQPLPDGASLSAYVGELIEMHMRDGATLRVTLEAIEGDSLRVTQRVGGGALGYTVKRDLIGEIYVMR